MDTLKLTLTCVALTLVLVSTTWAANSWPVGCAPCDGVSCTPPPPGCELGQRVCACCAECRAREGVICSAFSVECESDLVCFTEVGVFVGRPPMGIISAGRCIKNENIPPTSS